MQQEVGADAGEDGPGVGQGPEAYQLVAVGAAVVAVADAVAAVADGVDVAVAGAGVVGAESDLEERAEAHHQGHLGYLTCWHR